MAFNPFHKFRKHQKVIFAGLTIFCMFSFVMCSGVQQGGDMAGWLLSFFGGGRGGPAVDVATLYGKKVTNRELDDLRQQRELARAYLRGASEVAAERYAQDLVARHPPGSRPQDLQNLLFSARFTMMQALAPLIRDNNDNDALINFMIWRHVADTLGITLTEDDVNKLITRVTKGKLSRTDSGRVETFVRGQFKNSTPDQLAKALTEEFRVQIAQDAILGKEGSPFAQTTIINNVPAFPTPFEFWNFYKDQRTTVEVKLLPIKVEDFLAKVTEKPTDEELRALFTRFQDQELSPESRDPGFKRPRRVQIEWLSGKADSDSYRQEVLKNYEHAAGAMMIANSALLPALIGPGAAAAANLTLPKPFDLTLLTEYEFNHPREFRQPSWLKRMDFEGDVLHSDSINRPEHVAAMISAAAPGAGLTTAVPAVEAVGTFTGLATVREIDNRLKYGNALFALGASMSPFATAAGVYDIGQKDEYIPFPIVRSRLIKEVLGRDTRQLLMFNLKAVQKELEKLSKGKDRDAEIKKYLAKAVKDYNLQTGKTTALRDLHKSRLADDPGLKPFLEVFTKRETDGDEPVAQRFGKELLSPKKPFEVEYYPPPVGDSSIADEQFAFWKTEDQKSQREKFEDVKAEVEKAWRFQKARELARKHAEELAKEVNALAKDSPTSKEFGAKLIEFADKKKAEMLVLTPLAKQFPRKSTGGSFDQADYEPPTPKLLKKFVNYPNQKLIDDLVGMRTRNFGETILVTDEPESFIYVAALVHKGEPNQSDFYKVYKNVATGAKPHDRMFNNMEQELRTKYLKEVTERLRKDAKLEKKDGFDKAGGREGTDEGG